MNERNFLNLTHNPFVPPREGFFAGGDRKSHLEHLRHLSQWSRRILLVTGAFGIGKSTLYRELSNTLEPKVKAARLSGTVVTSERDALVSLIQGFGIAASPEASSDEMTQLVIQHTIEQETHHRFCVVMVDEAHLLDAAAIHRLIELVVHSPMRIVLFAESDVVASIGRACTKHGLEWFEIRLTGLPRKDVRDYLEWRFRQAKYRGLLPFTDEQVESITAQSAGNPGAIDEAASELLSRLATGELQRRSRFPKVHAVLAVLIAGLIGLIYLLALPEKDPDLVTVQIPAETLAQTVPEPEPRSQPRSAAPPAPQPARQSAQAPGILPEPETSRDEDRATALVESVQVQPAVPVVVREPVAARLPVVVQETIAAVEPPEPVEVVPPPEPSAKPVVAREPLTRGVRDAQWLLRQDPASFTLQLVSLSSRERAQAFVTRQADVAEFAIYDMTRNGRTLYVVTYGVFSSAAAAQRAADELTGELGKLTPWVRGMHGVQDGIRKVKG